MVSAVRSRAPTNIVLNGNLLLFSLSQNDNNGDQDDSEPSVSTLRILTSTDIVFDGRLICSFKHKAVANVIDVSGSGGEGEQGGEGEGVKEGEEVAAEDDDDEREA